MKQDKQLRKSSPKVFNSFLGTASKLISAERTLSAKMGLWADIKSDRELRVSQSRIL